MTKKRQTEPFEPALKQSNIIKASDFSPLEDAFLDGSPDENSPDKASATLGRSNHNGINTAQSSHQGRDFNPLQRKPYLWGSITILLVVGVIWIPQLIQPAIHKPASVDIPATTPKDTQGSNAEGTSSADQKQQLRRQAQDLQAQIKPLQAKLATMQVERWASQDFNTANQNLMQGDKAYQAFAYQQAVEHYQATLNQYTFILKQAPTILEQQLSQAQYAITQWESDLAEKSYRLALAISPQNTQAKAGLTIAQHLKSIRDLLRRADNAVRLEQWDQAEALLKEAKQLAPDFPPIVSAQASLQPKLVARDFQNAMSQGYEALALKAFNQAENAFIQADKIQPDPAAQAALAQTRQQRLTDQVQRHFTQAKQAVQQEDWQNAVEHYQKIQALDASASDARIGEIKAQARLTLDLQLQTYIQAPQRLSDKFVRQAAEQHLKDAKQLPGNEPKLKQQIQALDHQLSLLKQPVKIIIRSDGISQVRIIKGKSLGSFKQQSIALLPGRYVLTASRPGYRDVRQIIQVRAGQQGEWNIGCTEAI